MCTRRGEGGRLERRTATHRDQSPFIGCPFTNDVKGFSFITWGLLLESGGPGGRDTVFHTTGGRGGRSTPVASESGPPTWTPGTGPGWGGPSDILRRRVPRSEDSSSPPTRTPGSFLPFSHTYSRLEASESFPVIPRAEGTCGGRPVPPTVPPTGPCPGTGSVEQ